MMDVQNQKPKNEISLEKVGVKGLKKYLTVKRPERTYPVIATVNCYVNLPSNLRGAHMSRFAESLNEVSSKVESIESFAEKVSKNIQEKHQSHCHTEVFGELPFKRGRPNGDEEIGVAQMFGKFSTRNHEKKVGISVNGALACPCSKEMCKGRTHNQRGKLTVELDVSEDSVELFDIIDICRKSFSSPTYTTLKRPEEKEVVERMHENSRFIEDVVRECVHLLKEKYSGRKCKVECVSHESIHDHDVYSKWEGEL